MKDFVSVKNDEYRFSLNVIWGIHLLHGIMSQMIHFNFSVQIGLWDRAIPVLFSTILQVEKLHAGISHLLENLLGNSWLFILQLIHIPHLTKTPTKYFGRGRGISPPPNSETYCKHCSNFYQFRSHAVQTPKCTKIWKIIILLNHV